MDQNIGANKLCAAVRVQGKDSTRFLNGMLTQDIQKTGSCGRTFLLSPKGKIISSMYFLSLSPEEYILWTEEKNMEALIQGLSKYLIADQVELKPMGNFHCWTLMESEHTFQPLVPRTKFGLERSFEAIIDENFYIVPQGLLSPSHVEVLQLKEPMPSWTIASANDLWQSYFKAKTPQWEVDFFPEDFFLEYPLADSVSFDKGCYVGQETVARGTFRGKVNKSYAHVLAEKNLVAGDILTLSGEKVGTLRTLLGKQGRGIVKFDLGEHETFLINGEEFHLKIKHLVTEETFRKGR